MDHDLSSSGERASDFFGDRFFSETFACAGREEEIRVRVTESWRSLTLLLRDSSSSLELEEAVIERRTGVLRLEEGGRHGIWRERNREVRGEDDEDAMRTGRG